MDPNVFAKSWLRASPETLHVRFLGRLPETAKLRQLAAADRGVALRSQ